MVGKVPKKKLVSNHWERNYHTDCELEVILGYNSTSTSLCSVRSAVIAFLRVKVPKPMRRTISLHMTILDHLDKHNPILREVQKKPLYVNKYTINIIGEEIDMSDIVKIHIYTDESKFKEGNGC